MSPETRTDALLVIGSGIAGLSIAINYSRMHPDHSVRLLAKDELPDTNTELAQGGIAAAVGLEDRWELHANDTLKVGGKDSNAAIVRMVAKEAPPRIADLLKEGIPFDRDPSGSLDRGKEGGHTRERILHVGDRTGSSIHGALLQKAREIPNLELLPHRFATDLITENGRCKGAFVLDEKSDKAIASIASNTVLATGGAGQVYERTSNAGIATGDGYAMAERAGLPLRNMGSVQFHPTAFYQKGEDRAFLISEAVRGEGARLLNIHGEAFANRYHPKGELAPRRSLSHAIAWEMERTGSDHVFLDASDLSYQDFQKRFPSILAYCKEQGISPSEEAIPVAPAAHYCCGGIPVDAEGLTGMKGLWACGEVSFTGLHGADRLPSNSLLEGLVFSVRTSKALEHEVDEPFASQVPQPPYHHKAIPEDKKEELERIRQWVRRLMSQKAGIIRDEQRLRELSRDLKEMEEDLKGKHPPDAIDRNWMETLNLLTTARSIVADQLKKA